MSYCITHLGRRAEGQKGRRAEGQKGRRAISDCITWVVVSVTEEPDSYSEVMKAVISSSSDEISSSSDEMRLTYSLSRGLKN